MLNASMTWVRRVRRSRWKAPLVLFLAATGLIPGCMRPSPTSPTCIGNIGIDLAVVEVHAGQTFAATATHVVDQCLNNLTWNATGSIQYQFAEALSATFRANEEGMGTITVQNRFGRLGILAIDVSPAEDPQTQASPGTGR